MCIATASLIATGVSAAVGAAGAISSANASAAEATYQAQVAKNNQQIANQNAAYATQAGEAAATQQSLKGRATAGALVADLAASGLDVNSGSAVDARATQRELGELDTETTRQAAALQSYGFRTQSTNFAAEATLQQAKARAAPTAGLLSAAGSLVGGASSLADKWVRFQDAGVL